MGQDPDAIRQDIEHTREHMGDTVEAISYKTDVKSRTKDWVEDKTEGLREAAGSVRGRASRVRSKVSDATPDAGQIKQGTSRAVSTAESNPLGLAIGAMAAGFLIGLGLPRTKAEDEKLGPVADQVKQQAAEMGQEALERGKSVAQQAAQSAASTAKDEGARLAEELKEQAQARSSQLTDDM
jgi:hypothetical protein